MEKHQSTEPAPKRPPNCGTGHCSCIECVMEPAPSLEAQLRQFGEQQHARLVEKFGEPAPSTAGERAGERAKVIEDLLMYAGDNGYSHIDYADTMRHAAALLSAPALPVGELTPETATALYEQAFGVKLTDSAQIGGVLRLCHLAAASTQPVREPLTDEELDLICEKALFCRISFQQFARSIEAAHGIK